MPKYFPSFPSLLILFFLTISQYNYFLFLSKFNILSFQTFSTIVFYIKKSLNITNYYQSSLFLFTISSFSPTNLISFNHIITLNYSILKLLYIKKNQIHKLSSQLQYSKFYILHSLYYYTPNLQKEKKIYQHNPFQNYITRISGWRMPDIIQPFQPNTTTRPPTHSYYKASLYE